VRRKFAKVPVNGERTACLNFLVHEASRQDAVLRGQALYFDGGVAVENDVTDDENLELGETIDDLAETGGRAFLGNKLAKVYIQSMIVDFANILKLHF
jgi:hypothetical protein